MCDKLIKPNGKQKDDSGNLSDHFDLQKGILINEFIKRNCSGNEMSLKKFMNDIEKEIIIKALNISRGNQRIASFILNVNQTTLNEKMKRLNLRKNYKIKKPQDLRQFLSEINALVL